MTQGGNASRKSDLRQSARRGGRGTLWSLIGPIRTLALMSTNSHISGYCCGVDSHAARLQFSTDVKHVASWTCACSRAALCLFHWPNLMD